MFIIILIALGIIYRGQVDERTQLEARLDMTQKLELSYQIDQLNIKKEDLTAQLAQLDQQNVQFQSSLSHSLDAIRISDTLYQIASDNRLALSEVKTASGGRETVEKARFDTLELYIVALGEVSDLTQFVLHIISKYPTSVIESVNIRTAPDEAGKYNANIELIIYSYKGS